MTFSENFFNLFNKLLEQIGVAIDWTATNAIPYVTELGMRVVKFDTIKHIVTVIGCLIVLIILLTIIYKITRTKEWWTEPEALLLLIPAGISIGVCFKIYQDLIAITQNILIPELTIIQMLQGVI